MIYRNNTMTKIYENKNYIKISREAKLRLREQGATYNLAILQLLDFWDQHHDQ